jgi:predicted transposase/invertase (TIGR01784 family)
MIYLELPKFGQIKLEDLSSVEEYWLYLLKNITNLSEDEKMKVLNKIPDLKNAFHILELYATDPNKRREVEERIRTDDHYAMELAAHYELGELEGELKSKIETAKKMKEEGLSLEQIMRITGLSLEEINQA